MKLRALGNLSGATGEVEKGAEFSTDATTGQALIDRGLAVKVDSAAPAAAAVEPSGKPVKEKG
ncbi:hypothetical protein ABQX22_13700 [Xanthomonas sp. WHRI 1810A]|uniref:hypothetical protein n=1 Tax=Xanthomonas sp. WHRI 1810A TaxID=3161565 RepID=UPI0032E86810